MRINHADRVEAAYRRMHPQLWHALYAYCGDYEIAIDAEAEAFTQVIRRGDVVRDIDGWTWRAAFRIAAGLLADRSATRPVRQFSTNSDDVIDEFVVDFVSQLADLSEQQRAVVVLRYVGQFTPAEIAELLQTTSGTVRVQLHRAHAQLRVSLEKAHG